ncbi:uncharacterized protein LOC116303784 [Actinia tenebrosa]|uniref:Uncharacterized protein LOC116303784 n=1 Tax=Actinia tenebrosa TaxID=6105 RepID=A0A6P8IQR2_ACTTE|nr:uncharacterized protein LOC116303784 [Actinia tenebrosa]
MARPRKGCFPACKIIVLVLVISLSLYSTESFYPHTVKNHVVVNQDDLIDGFPAQDWISCIMSCQNDPKCFSYNYQYEKKENGLCELYGCGVDQEKELTKQLVYSYGFLFQQLKHHKEMKLCAKQRVTSKRPTTNSATPGKGSSTSTSNTAIPSTTAVPTGKACCRDWIRNNQTCYLAVHEPKTWTKSYHYCKRKGGNLTSIHSRDENTFIVNKMTANFKSDFFFVGSIISRNNRLVWSDGTVFNFYQNWKSNNDRIAKNVTNFSSKYVRIEKSLGKWISSSNPPLDEFESVCKHSLYE